jgi:hypothetical protein
VLGNEAYTVAALHIPRGAVARALRAPPRVRVRVPSRWQACRVVRRRMRPDVVPSAPVESADRSVVGAVVLKGPQRPPGQVPGR